ncbi:helix-turn-helix domain-containing protein [Serratia fonticola]|uniref:helix-turn-helix domain-containing protein n=1 Tax=Serratia fonticola TaxID=47917 RepID=UPI003BB6D273
MNIVILDQNLFYANGLKELINEFLLPDAAITINDSSLLYNADLVIRTPAFSSKEELQGAFNRPQTLYIYYRPLPDDMQRRDNALYRSDPMSITLATLALYLEYISGGCPSQPYVLKKLSANEIQMMKLIKRGWNSKQIADNFHLSIKTVSQMRCNAIKKIGLRNRLELYKLLNKLHF